MGRHVIAGAGQVGAHLARHLLAQGHEVVVVTRSGSGPAEAERVTADVTDSERLTQITKGADALHNCAGPAYTRWARDWPPLAASLLTAAEATDAVLVTAGNLYGYGPVNGPMTEDLPLTAPGTKGQVRARMWTDALAAHEAGRARITEVRGSDYFGPGASDQTPVGTRFVPSLLAGKRTVYLGDPDQPHSWTYLPDVATAMATVATDERAWGKPWHVPNNPPLSARALAERLCAHAEAPAPRVTPIPGPIRFALELASPLVRELKETRYQFDRPFIVDSSAFETTFGVTATPLDEAVAATVAAARND
ncbi:NAD-dependent epimerase/dehydratase family protein [Nocardia uniformis]|uniref:NAD-dependent epimerase/dehydratase family protein n=1 Tax=Nocardia uniformis TaxID=53432 RepID=A0A849C2C1_9NOCA|nr:NAD-dependent epimerase/dehydratase family protein [Nocardia uniformis]NNH69987.1 NAD-dependent epimerase/dehydratase family protein [Nocardia uniformis]